jgi:hypothetical protein
VGDLALTVTLEPPKFQSPAEMKQVVTKSLRIFDSYYRRRVQQRFAAQGPGWAPRKEDDGREAKASEARGTQARALAEHKLKIKLFRQLTRARKQWLKGKGTEKSVIRRARVIEEFKRQMGGEVSPFFSSDKRLEKSVSGLRERMTRAEQKASERILGRFPSAMKSRLQGMVLTVLNTIPFSGVQNEGGVVGHGAELDARPFNYFEAIDAEVFSEIVVNMMLVAAAA